MAACSLGAFINLVIANHLYSNGTMWAVASLAGILVGAVWNYTVTTRFAWGKRRGAPAHGTSSA